MLSFFLKFPFIASLILFAINFAPDFMIISFISPLKNRVKEDFLVVAAVYFPEVVHVQLSNKGTPIRVSKILCQCPINKLIFVKDDELASVLTEVQGVREMLHKARITFIILRSLLIKSGFCLLGGSSKFIVIKHKL